MAVALRKYERQIAAAGGANIPQVSPSLGQNVIEAQEKKSQAAVQKDLVTAEIISKAGGLVAQYFDDRAKSADAELLSQYEQAKLDTNLNIQTRLNKSIQAGEDYEKSYGKIIKEETAALKDKLSTFDFSYKSMERNVQEDFNNFSIGLNISDQENQIKLAEKARESAISAEATRYTKIAAQLSENYFKAVDIAENQEQIEEALKIYKEQIGKYTRELQYPINKQKAKVSAEVFELANPAKIGFRLAAIDVENDIKQTEDIVQDAIDTDKYENPAVGSISIGGVEYPTGKGQSEIIYNAALDHLIRLNKIDARQASRRSAEYKTNKIWNNWKQALKRDIGLAEEVMSQKDFPRDLYATAQTAVMEAKDKATEELQRQQKENNLKLTKENITATLLQEARGAPTLNVRGMTLDAYDPKVLTTASKIFFAEMQGGKRSLDETDRMAYDRIVNEIKLTIETNETADDTFNIIHTQLNELELTPALYMGLMKDILFARDISKDDFGVEEKKVFAELLGGLDAFIADSGLDFGVDSHLSLLETFYETVFVEDKKRNTKTIQQDLLDQFKNSQQYKDFLMLKAANDVNQIINPGSGLNQQELNTRNIQLTLDKLRSNREANKNNN